MNLLLTRSQARAGLISIVPLRIGGTVTFKLNAEFELNEEEVGLARKYSFTNATLIASNLMDDLKRAYAPALTWVCP